MERPKSVLMIAFVAAFGLALAAAPAMGNDGPDYTINPNHSTGDDTPWVEFTDHPAPNAAMGLQYMVMQAAQWLVDEKPVESEDSTKDTDKETSVYRK